MSRWMRTYLYGTMILVFGIMCVRAYWQLRPYHILVENDSYLRVEAPVVRQGELLYYTRRWCKATDAYVALVTRVFVDGVQYVMPTTAVRYPSGCAPSLESVRIPTIPPGRYHLVSNVDFRVNPLRIVHYEFESATFEVQERSGRP